LEPDEFLFKIRKPNFELGEYSDYANWFLKLIEDYSKRHGAEPQSISRFCERNCFFITAMFSRDRIRQRLGELDLNVSDSDKIIFQNYDLLYKAFCRNVLGRYFDRNRYRDSLPLSIAVLDVEGTRGNSSVSLLEERNRHLHALIVFPEAFTEKFERYRSSHEFRTTVLDRLDTDRVKIERFDSAKSPLLRLVSYAQKYLEFESSLEFGQLAFRIYPRDNFNPNFVKPVMPILRTRSRKLEKLQKLRKAALKERATRESEHF
jgi:hypothetical protein